MTRFGVLALAALALALPACGDDDDSAGDGSRPDAADQSVTTTEESGKSSETDAPDAAPGDGGSGDEDGGSEEGGSGRQTPALAEYIRRADQICRSSQVSIARHGAEYRELTKQLAQRKIERPEYLRRAGEITERSGEIAERAVADLKELPTPSSRQGAIEAYLRGAEIQSATLTAQGEALKQGRAQELATGNRRIAAVGQETRTAARRVGFHVCGGGGG